MPLTQSMFWILTYAYQSIMGPPDPRGTPPKTSPVKLNRVDAYPQLLAYHDTSKEPKPRPTRTELLPLRTFVPSNYNPLSDLYAAQTHAYYEEIDSIRSVVVGEMSPFEETGHWYIIHPLLPSQVRGLSTLVLDELNKWMEACLDVYIGKAKQIEDFNAVRNETLELVRRELDRRGAADRLDNEEGYLGRWEDVSEDFRVEDQRKIENQRPELGRKSTTGTITEAGLAEADKVAMQMVEELWKMNDQQISEDT